MGLAVPVAMGRFAGLAVLLAAGAFALLFGGGEIVACIGPIGVTPVECAANTGRLPHGTLAQPLCALALVAAGALIVGLRRSEILPAAIGLVVGLPVGLAVYLVARPDVLSGYTSRGEFLTIPLPPDPNVAAMSALLAGGSLALAAVLFDRALSRMRRQPSR